MSPELKKMLNLNENEKLIQNLKPQYSVILLTHFLRFMKEGTIKI